MSDIQKHPFLIVTDRPNALRRYTLLEKQGTACYAGLLLAPSEGFGLMFSSNLNKFVCSNLDDNDDDDDARTLAVASSALLVAASPIFLLASDTGSTLWLLWVSLAAPAPDPAVDPASASSSPFSSPSPAPV